MTNKFSNISYKNPLLMLAPMEGITNFELRSLLLEKSSPDVVATEFIRITGPKQKLPIFKEHSCPLQIQLMASNAKDLKDCILFLKNKKILNDDSWIDLNVGCPSKRVNARGAGAALLCEPVKLMDIINSIREVHSGTLSIKTRVGYQSDEDYPKLLSTLSSAPIDLISIHARTKKDAYSNPVNLEYLKLAKESLPYPVIGNGEIWNLNDAIKMLNETKVDGLMCGRGAISNPFIFKEIKGYLRNENYSVNRKDLIDFAESLLNKYINTPKKIGLYKEFSIWFSKNPLIGRSYFQEIKTCKNFNEIQEINNILREQSI